MSNVDRLLADYITEHRSGGEANPVVYLDRVEPGDRSELAALIDAYLSRAPRTPFDAAAFHNSDAEATADALERSLAGDSGLWPLLLPRLRTGVGLKRREVTDRLAQALGAADRAEKVERYYHEMEQGTLPAAGVGDRVLEALAALVDTSASFLREAGSAVTGRDSNLGAPTAFARSTQLDATPSSPPAASRPAHEEHWDEIDELFCGAG
jgi:hypothetical protein